MLTKIFLMTVLCIPILQSADSISALNLIKDDSGKAGAIIHFVPDHPVAGEVTRIFYDLGTGKDLENSAVALEIADDTGGIDEFIPVSVDKATVSGFFVFPKRDTYTIALAVTKHHGSDPETQFYKTRLNVSTGLHGLESRPSAPLWAKIGLVLSVWGLLVLVIKGFKHKAIYNRGGKS